jgi:predicted small metal-binding protein
MRSNVSGLQAPVNGEEVTMSKVIECPCGVVLRDDDDDALVATAQNHARETHQMELSQEQARDMAHPE